MSDIEVEKPSELSAETGDSEFSGPDPVRSEDIFSRPDAVLQDLVDYAHIIGIGVTLYLPWGAASGNIIGGAEYFEKMAEGIRESGAKESADKGQVADLYAKTFDRWATALQPPSEDDETYDPYLSRFIHLKDVTCSIPGPISPIRHEYLRVQLSHVTAWSSGVIQYPR